MDNDSLLTVAEAARILRVHPETIRRWLREGTMAGKRPRSRQAGYRIRQADVQRFLGRGPPPAVSGLYDG